MIESKTAARKTCILPPKTGVGYRYGFNGKEKTDEMFGDGSDVDFGDRFVDTRVGRWWGVDPLSHHYPGTSPYSFGLNNPNIFCDDGGKKIYIYYKDESGKERRFRYCPGMKVPDVPSVAQETVRALNEIHKIDKPTVQPEGFSPSDPSPKQVIEELHTSKYIVNVHAEDFQTWQADETHLKGEAIARTFKGATQSDIYYCPEVGAIELDAMKNRTGVRRSAIGLLAHEIKHGYENSKGTVFGTQNSKEEESTASEADASKFENVVSENKGNPEGERHGYSDYIPTHENNINEHKGNKAFKNHKKNK